MHKQEINKRVSTSEVKLQQTFDPVMAADTNSEVKLFPTHYFAFFFFCNGGFKCVSAFTSNPDMNPIEARACVLKYNLSSPCPNGWPVKDILFHIS